MIFQQMQEKWKFHKNRWYKIEFPFVCLVENRKFQVSFPFHFFKFKSKPQKVAEKAFGQRIRNIYYATHSNLVVIFHLNMKWDAKNVGLRCPQKL